MERVSRYGFAGMLLLLVHSGYGQVVNGWKIFEKASFKEEYVEEFGAFITMLESTPEINKYDNTTIELTGYFIPIEEVDVIILSKFPFASCFFCGAAGLESVVEVRMAEKPKRSFKMDDKLKFRGRLEVNSTDWARFAFILNEAILIK